MKRDRPKATVAELVRDFRVDEEEGMDADSKLENKSNNVVKLNLADALSSMKKQPSIINSKPDKNMS